jgi:hypothetical protein
MAGLPIDATSQDLNVEEDRPDKASLEWSIQDAVGHFSAFYFRITSSDSTLTPVGLFLDNSYGGDTQVLFKGIPNTECGIDVAVIPLSMEGFRANSTEGRILCHVEFGNISRRMTSEVASEKSSYLNPPHTGSTGFEHICQPFCKQQSLIEATPYWRDYDNHVFAFAFNSARPNGQPSIRRLQQ